MNILITSLTLLACALMITEARSPMAKRNDLACPDYPFWFEIEDSDPLCKYDSDCAGDEKCCPYATPTLRCKQGIVTTPKPGKCPLNPYNHGCLADYIGCQFDSECDGANKCCKNMHCGYNDCQAP